MADHDERLIKPISERQFELYALSLERGLNFDPAHIFAAYQVGRGNASGCILLDPERGVFITLALRRRIDHCWVRVDDAGRSTRPKQPSIISASPCEVAIRPNLFRPGRAGGGN